MNNARNTQATSARRPRRWVQIAGAVAGIALLAGCSTSGGEGAEKVTPTSTSILPDGSVEVYEVDADGTVIGTIDPTSDADPSAGGPTDSGAAGTPTDHGQSSGDPGSDGPAPAGPAGPAEGGSEETPAPSEQGEPAPAPTPEPAPQQTAPSVSVSSQRCSGGQLVVSLTAKAGNGYRKGIKAVSLARQNEYGNFLTSNAAWLGPETGAGNVWNGSLVANQQNIGKTLRVTATSDAGQSVTKEYPISAPC